MVLDIGKPQEPKYLDEIIKKLIVYKEFNGFYDLINIKQTHFLKEIPDLPFVQEEILTNLNQLQVHK